MRRWQWWHRAAMAPLTAAAIAAASFTAAPAASAAQICTSAANPALAAKMSRDIASSYSGRTSHVGVEVVDPAAGIGITCGLHNTWRFYSASTVKATILAALLRKAGEQHRNLSAKEKSKAWSMITVSDNNAATYLWNDVGMWWLRHFLNLACMTRTTLGTCGHWGLTLETAYDEPLLLLLLVKPNSVLTPAPRDRACRPLESGRPASCAASACALPGFLTGPLLENPYRVGHLLRDEQAGQYSARCRPDWRVRYRIEQDTRTVIVLDISHRSDTYGT